MSPEFSAVPSSSSSLVNGLLLEDVLEVELALSVDVDELLDVLAVLEVDELLTELRMLVSEL
jgi:hypothetical protein